MEPKEEQQPSPNWNVIETTQQLKVPSIVDGPGIAALTHILTTSVADHYTQQFKQMEYVCDGERCAKGMFGVTWHPCVREQRRPSTSAGTHILRTQPQRVGLRNTSTKFGRQIRLEARLNNKGSSLTLFVFFFESTMEDTQLNIEVKRRD